MATAEWRVYDERRCWIAEWRGGGETLASPDVAGSLLLVVPTGCPSLVDAVNPAGPDGPVVAGGPVGMCETPSPYGSLDPLEHSVLDHADPAGQHADVQDTLEPLEHSVLDTILECRPMEGIPHPEPLEHTVLDSTLDGRLVVEKISDWEPVAHPVLDATLDGRPMEGTTNPEPLEHLVLVKALDSELMEGMPIWNR